jgi:putative transposase
VAARFPHHLQIETPEANLAAGMKWFQGTYTQRFHARNRTCGHLFQGRYKAIPVSGEDDYFLALSAYIHLNPVRAGLREVLASGLGSYPWSSYPLYMRGRRPVWLRAERVLLALGFADSPQGRLGYKGYIAGRASETADGKAGKPAAEWKALRRGWYFGGREFRQFLEQRMESLPGRREATEDRQIQKKRSCRERYYNTGPLSADLAGKCFGTFSTGKGFCKSLGKKTLRSSAYCLPVRTE